MYYIVRETSKVFPHKIKEPDFKILPKSQFSEFVLESPIAEHMGDNKIFLAHIPESELICICLEKFNDITKGMESVVQNLFLQAVVLHEMYYLWSEAQKLAGKPKLTEEDIHKKMKREFPLWENILHKAAPKSAPSAY